MKKMTYVEALEIAIAVIDNEEAKDRLIALRDATVKRNSADRKPTKTQEANEAVKTEIMDLMVDGTARTVGEIMEAVESLHGASNQKASALVRQLKDAGLLIREEIKRKAYFKVA